MTPENTQKLFEAFPQLYRGRFKPEEESMMSYGFNNCGDGWFDLLWKLSQAIEDTARTKGLEQHSNTWPEVLQVKQKLGGLRFYLKNASEAMWILIDQAVVIAEQTCEVCGASVSGIGFTLLPVGTNGSASIEHTQSITVQSTSQSALGSTAAIH